MAEYVGIDVSLEEVWLCVMDEAGDIVREGKVVSDPDAIRDWLLAHAPRAIKIGIETGPTSTWLWHALRGRDLPVICVDARHAKRVLSLQLNKNDRNDARGLARLMRSGWYKEVRVKSLDSHLVRATLASRALLVATRRDVQNQIRGLLKTHGLVVGKAYGKLFAARVRELLASSPALLPAIEPLLDVRDELGRHIDALDRQTMAWARDDEACQRSMSVPGIGPITSLAFHTAIEDPGHFRRSRSVGAFFGLTPRRYQPGEIDRSGRISKCGDRMVRTCLFEAAGVLLTRVQAWSSLKAWGVRLAKTIGFKKAKIAVARKLAVILHRMCLDGTTFRPGKEQAA
jgi:transposase